MAPTLHFFCPIYLPLLSHIPTLPLRPTEKAFRDAARNLQSLPFFPSFNHLLNRFSFLLSPAIFHGERVIDSLRFPYFT